MSSERLRRAELLLDMNRPREAAELASKEIAASPSDADAWVVLSRSYEAMNDLPRALDIANRAIGLEPSAADAHLIASRVLRSLGNSGESIRAAQEAVRLAPMNATTHANLAIALAAGRLGESLFGLFLPRQLRLAKDHAMHALALAPSSTAGHFASGFVAARSRRPRQARAHYRRVLAIDPQNAGAMNNLALLDLGRGRVAKGGSGFAKALAADPTLNLARRNVSGLLHNLAFAFHALGWLIYFCFSGIEANQQIGPLTFAWTTRCTVACWLAGVYAIVAVAVHARLDARVRAFGRQMIAESWIRKTVLISDVVTLACFAIAVVGRGVIASDVYLFGILGIGIAWTGLQLSRPRGHS